MSMTPSTPDPSPREVEILRWVAAGLTDRQIGARLGISHTTVKSHLQRVAPKLLGPGQPVKRAALVLVAERRGLLGRPAR